MTLDDFMETHRSLSLPQRGDLVRLLRRSKMVRYDPTTRELTPAEGIPSPWCQWGGHHNGLGGSKEKN